MAMGLSQYTARLAQVDPEALWDTGMVVVLSAFGLSRALLVVENLRMFLAHPVLVLELPSLTKEGLFLTVAVAAVYVWRKGLALLRALDAAAPCGVLFWASLELGSVADGSRAGMPTAVPWAIASVFGRVHPVEVYSAIAALSLCGALLWVLRRRRRAGETAGWGLALAGLLLFVLDFFRLPLELYGTSRLDGIEVRALQVMVSGGALLAWAMARGAVPGDLGDAV